MSKKRPTPFENIQLVGIHKEPTFGLSSCNSTDKQRTLNAPHRVIEQLQAKLDKAINALRDLHDEQNGPPLFRREKQWQTAMDKAEEVLKESD